MSHLRDCIVCFQERYLIKFCVFCYSNEKYEEFELPKQGGEDGVKPEFGSTESLPEPERPPLRHIDKYIAPECPCLTKRYTVAMLTCMGFIISFGMRCNMGMAKLQLEHKVSNE